jgi:hypothetical protein
MAQDDLGAALLRRHPRAAQWQQLEVAAANLTFEQAFGLAAAVPQDGSREQARSRVLAGVAGEIGGRLASRWARWADTFGLPTPDPDAPQPEQLAYPYQPAATAQRQAYLDSLMPLFDAALGILAAPADRHGDDDCAALTAPWRRVCLPTFYTPATAYGPHTQAALSVLRFAVGMPTAALARMVDARCGIDEQVWQDARVEVDTAGMDAGYPYRTRSLYWECVLVAEQATQQCPTDRELVDALSGAAVVLLVPRKLPPATVALLCAPYRASGAVLPN